METAQEGTAAILAAAGRHRLECLAVSRLGLVAAPAGAEEWRTAGERLHALGEGEGALAAFERAAELDPGHGEGWMAVATLRSQLGRPLAALEACNRGLALDPENPSALVNAGLLLRDLGDPEAALHCLDRALAADPGRYAALLAKAQLLAALQRLDAAAEAFRACLARTPGDADAASGLAEVALAAGDFRQAADLLEALLPAAANSTPIRIALAVAWAGLGDDARADALLARAKDVDPAGCAAWRPFFAADQMNGRAILESQRFRVALEFTALFRCRWGGREGFSAWLESRLADPGAVIDDPDIPFVALGLDLSPRARRALAAKVARRLAASVAGYRLPPRVPAKPGDRLRLGYLTGDLREHPIGRLASRLFGLHDRQRFRVHVYHTGPREDCPARRRAEAEAEVFRDVSAFPAAAVAEAVAADGIDILVDLSGYTLFNRTAALALRPAPVQAAYLGYFGTLGADFVDYAFADRSALLPEVRVHWQEAIAYLPDTFFLCDDSLEAPAGAEARAELGLPAEGFVFACLNATWKVEPAVFGMWMRLLHRIPGSVLWLFDGGSPQARDNLVREAAVRGIGPDRLVFAERVGYEDYLRRYRVVDLVLNTLGYSGNTTTVEALAMNVPVLSFAGRELQARAAASILRAHGLPELVVETLEEYEAAACRLAEAPAELAALKRKVAATRAASRLFCTQRRVREIERAYGMMWERHLAGLAPADFDVPPLD